MKGIDRMKLLPTGIENFKTMIDKSAYYVDKTNFIEDVLNEQVVSYTRPRRFGKTLNMSMLYYFFSINEKENSYLFNGLNISKNKDTLKYQNKYPTIFISLKEMKSLTFDAQISSFSNVIYELLEKNLEILSSDQLSDTTKDILNKLHNRLSSIEDLKISLRVITNALYTYYQKKVIVLIDEYDVPLQAAYQNNYYEEMVDFLRSVFSSALKTNDALEKGVMTGCLRISKESIFTGLNNISSESFGFTELEVKQLLKDYNLSEKMDEVKEWYDGYRFGNKEIYNPWSTLMYVKNVTQDVSFKPISFWANTSGNDLVVKYIQNGDKKLRKEFDLLMSGQSLIKYIKPELTYREMDNINNIYSFLLLTGYLKVIKDRGENQYELVIPNKEVYEIYKQSFMSYFEDYTTSRKGELYQELVDGDAKKVNLLLNDYEVVSNRESGNGRFDVCVLPENILGTVVLIECKHSISEDELIDDAKEGARQIIEQKYLEEHKYKKYENAVGYGISFYKKQCYVIKVEYDSKM